MFVVLGAKGAVLRRPAFSRIWAKALKEAGLSGVHLPALRHTGNTFAFQSGATLRELMDRMGHSTARATLIHLHADDLAGWSSSRWRVLSHSPTSLETLRLGAATQSGYLTPSAAEGFGFRCTAETTPAVTDLCPPGRWPRCSSSRPPAG